MRSYFIHTSTLSRRSLLGLVGLGAAAGLGACGAPVRLMAPPGLEPLEAENTAPAPTSDERINFVSGQAEGHSWVHGRGRIARPLEAVWAALRDPDACVNRREVTRWRVSRDTEMQYRSSFVIHNTVNSVITVEFDVAWRQDIVDGTEAAPTAVAARFEKTEGSDVIALMQGSVRAQALAGDATALEFIEHLDAFGRGAETAQSFLQDLYDTLRELAHGRPMPTYR